LIDRKGVPVIGIAGWVDDSAKVLLEEGFDVILSITKHPMSLEEAMDKAYSLVADIGEQICRMLRI